MALSIVATFFSIGVTMIIGLVVTAPDYQLVPLLAAVGAVAVVVPLLLSPFTYTLWLAFDLAVHKPTERELAEAAAAVAAAAPLGG